MKSTSSLLLAFTLFLATFSTGCSFSRAWSKASKEPTPTNDITGRWEGKWLSDRNGHNGRLRCVVTHDETGQYQFHYHAVYWKILRAGYQVKLDVQREGDNFILKGNSDLGWLGGGVYDYEGKASPTNFFSTYKSKYDHGTFQMTRP